MPNPFPTNKPLEEVLVRPMIKKNVPCSRYCEVIVAKSPWMYCNCTKHRK